MNKINIIDCTLRDGGYYNNWDFSNNLVNEYLKSVWSFCKEYPFYAVAFFYGGYLIGVFYF